MSTNIAETSVTIDGVRFIVDSGKVGIVLGFLHTCSTIVSVWQFMNFSVN